MEEQFPQFSLSSYFLIYGSSLRAGSSIEHRSSNHDTLAIPDPLLFPSSFFPYRLFFFPLISVLLLPEKMHKGSSFQSRRMRPEMRQATLISSEKSWRNCAENRNKFSFFTKKKGERNGKLLKFEVFISHKAYYFFFFYDGKTLLKKSKFQLTQRSSVLITNESNFHIRKFSSS